jgi:hypothetical protein
MKAPIDANGCSSMAAAAAVAAVVAVAAVDDDGESLYHPSVGRQHREVEKQMEEVQRQVLESVSARVHIASAASHRQSTTTAPHRQYHCVLIGRISNPVERTHVWCICKKHRESANQ